MKTRLAVALLIALSAPAVALAAPPATAAPSGVATESPADAAFRALYEKVALEAIQVVAKGSSNPEAYTYLAESIRNWPAQAELADLVREAGWGDVAWTNLTGGIVALHTATRPLG